MLVVNILFSSAPILNEGHKQMIKETQGNLVTFEVEDEEELEMLLEDLLEENQNIRYDIV